MEQQPGPVNWAPFNPIPAPGMVKLWALEAMPIRSDDKPEKLLRNSTIQPISIRVPLSR